MNVLIIAPMFYPDKSVGALRMTSLARFLINKGVNLWVLTNKKEVTEIDFKAQYVFVDSIKTGNFLTEYQNNRERYVSAFETLTDIVEIDAIIISGGPFYTFHIAIEARKKKIKCFLDFRDPWIFDRRENTYGLKNLIRKAYYLPEERKAVGAATLVVTVTDRWVQTFQRYYPSCRAKFRLIENGFDDGQLSMLRKAELQKEKRITLAVFGKLFYYTDKYSKVFTKALKKYTNDISVLQVGQREEQVNRILEQFGLDQCSIKSTGFIQYSSGMEILMNADCFLIIDARKDAIGTKIYDYIFLGKPIIYVGPKDSYISDIIRQYGLGYSCDSSEKVERAFNRLLSHGYHSDIDENLKVHFARSHQNEKWWELLNG